MTLLHSTSGPQAHLALEAAACLLGGRIYWFQARRTRQPASLLDRWRLLACVLFGAALGSKLLHAVEHLGYYAHAPDSWAFLGGKSILGGLVGGTLGAEVGKRWVGWHASTGDAWVPAIAVGLIVGRLGCQVSGLWDGTFGIPTRLPWGWDYGDGMPRHPAAAYEMLAVAICWALVRKMPAQPSGAAVRRAVRGVSRRLLPDSPRPRMRQAAVRRRCGERLARHGARWTHHDPVGGSARFPRLCMALRPPSTARPADATLTGRCRRTARISTTTMSCPCASSVCAGSKASR